MLKCNIKKDRKTDKNKEVSFIDNDLDEGTNNVYSRVVCSEEGAEKEVKSNELEDKNKTNWKELRSHVEAVHAFIPKTIHKNERITSKEAIDHSKEPPNKVKVCAATHRYRLWIIS